MIDFKLKQDPKAQDVVAYGDSNNKPADADWRTDEVEKLHLIINNWQLITIKLQIKPLLEDASASSNKFFSNNHT